MQNFCSYIYLPEFKLWFACFRLLKQIIDTVWLFDFCVYVLSCHRRVDIVGLPFSLPSLAWYCYILWFEHTQKFAQSLFYDLAFIPIFNICTSSTYTAQYTREVSSCFGYRLCHFRKINSNSDDLDSGSVGSTHFICYRLYNEFMFTQKSFSWTTFVIIKLYRMYVCGCIWCLCIRCFQRIICIMQMTWQLSNQNGCIIKWPILAAINFCGKSINSIILFTRTSELNYSPSNSNILLRSTHSLCTLGMQSPKWINDIRYASTWNGSLHIKIPLVH